MAPALAAGVSISGATLAQIVVQAAEAVEGAQVRRPRRGLDVVVRDGWARVALELRVRHDVVLPELARAVQESVAAALAGMCGLRAEGVDVAIEELV